MYREEVIAKALRELRDKLKTSLEANKMRQRELVESIAEHQLAMRTLSSLVKTKQAPTISPAVPSPPRASEPEPVSFSPPLKSIPVATMTNIGDRKGYSREKLKSLAFPIMRSRFQEEPFEVSKIRDLLDELEPDVSHSYEAAWNLCNDLLREGKLKPAGIKKLPKGVARLFKLKTAMGVAAPPEKAAPAGG